MATMVVLVETETPSISLDAEAVGQLGGLGSPTSPSSGMKAPSASFSRGGRFELAGDDGGARAFHPVGQVAVSTVSPHYPKEI